MEKCQKSNILSKKQSDLISNIQQEIESRINSYNGLLTSSFKEQEEKLLATYKQELQKAKKELQQLEETQSEALLKKRTQEKHEQLKVYEEKVLQESQIYQ